MKTVFALFLTAVLVIAIGCDKSCNLSSGCKCDKTCKCAPCHCNK